MTGHKQLSALLLEGMGILQSLPLVPTRLGTNPGAHEHLPGAQFPVGFPWNKPWSTVPLPIPTWIPLLRTFSGNHLS